MLDTFYADVLPRSGYLCLWTKHDKQHIWAEDQSELINLTKAQGDNFGVYFGTASYQSHSRKQHNVRALRSLRLDIDAGAAKFAKHPDGAYATQPLAISALVAFIKTTNLMPTYIVSSGEGLHVYWCMDDDVAPEVWQPMAAGLQALGNAQGLRIDSTCTQDSARILRPLGTLHENGHQVAVLKATGKIWPVALLQKQLAVVARIDPVIPAVPKGAYDMSVNADVQITTVQRAPVSAIAVAAQCAALNEIARSGGDVPEPQWRAMLGLVKHTIEGEDLAHEWSMGYDGYDEAETQKKIEGWNAGPTTCAEFARHTKACETCPHKGRFKSPILLVEPSPTTTVVPERVEAVSAVAAPLPPKPAGVPWEGRIPPGFEVKSLAPKPGYVMVQHRAADEDEDGRPVVTEVPFSHTVFWMGHWAGATSSDTVARVQVYRLESDGHVTSFTMEQTVVAVQRELIRFLGGQHIHLTNHRGAPIAMHDFNRAAMQLITHTGKRLQIDDHLGLRITPKGELIATQGEHTIFPDGHIEHSMIAQPLRGVAAQFRVPLPNSGKYGEWGPEVWPYIEDRARQYVAFLHKHFGRAGMERIQLAIMMGLASPIMPFVTDIGYHSGTTLPRGGLTVSLFSRESARGKTTAVRAAILAFGNPDDLTNDGGRMGTTELARVSRLTIHGTLPNIMDEMGGADPKQVTGVVNMVANGSSRERGNKEGGLNISAPWSLINLITTNTSQRDMIANIQESSDAIQRRLLEINVEGMPDHDREARNDFKADWSAVSQNCTGAFGAVLHRELCRMGVAKANELGSQCVSRADAIVDAKVAERFQYRGLGALLALHVVMKGAGFELFPLKGVIDAFKVAHAAGQDFIANNVMPTDGLEILSRMLHDLIPNTLITENETRRVNGQPHIKDTVLNDRTPDIVHARHVRSLMRTYVSVDAMREWCRKHSVPESEVIKRARDESVLRTFGERNLSSEKFNLYKGLPTSTNTFIKVYAFEVRTLARKLGLQEFDVMADEPMRAPARVTPLHAAA